ncbi:DUF6266 family protein [Odoribacter sp. AF15-53]|uniref:DUF6266 family protein n=1 Tax=Odoribacter sp. AF15-53 TaxID=2292236 RepID=UPI000E54C421|nr:DUF6266 family protein [Odoribacter sp. AF15-53]RHR82818.1 hypothetical protein DWW52_02850 [Odoribacter sp. AF15-53]
MAKFNSYLLGKVKKSVGNVTMCVFNRENIAKAKIFSRKDVKTPEILTQRAKMKALVGIARKMLPVIRKGFTGVGRGNTSNAFVALNMGAIEVDENYVATMNFEQMLCASGALYTPKVSVTFDTENKVYSFTQEMQDDEGDGFSCTNDKVYAALYETALNRAKLVTLRTRGESGSTSTSLPEDWEPSKVHAYCFATSKNGKMVSDSRHLTIE